MEIPQEITKTLYMETENSKTKQNQEKKTPLKVQTDIKTLLP